MSGRDVRRVAARASLSGHHEKQQQVTRLVLGALEYGVDEIYLANEPFRINVRAVENLPQRRQIRILDFQLSHSDQDTKHMLNLMWDAGCRVFIILGGDGTNRIVAKTRPEAIILPLSTGTNNVFPQHAEASIAGAAAALIASNKLKYQDHCYRCKRIHIAIDQIPRDIALIDAVLLQGDILGSLLPFSPDHLNHIFLARAEPAAVGTSPIGGYLMPCSARDDFGVMLHCGDFSAESPGAVGVRVPISPGLYTDVAVASTTRMVLGKVYECTTPGILAFDGDRSIVVEQNQRVEVVIRRDGPWIIEPASLLDAAARQGLLLN